MPLILRINSSARFSFTLHLPITPSNDQSVFLLSLAQSPRDTSPASPLASLSGSWYQLPAEHRSKASSRHQSCCSLPWQKPLPCKSPPNFPRNTARERFVSFAPLAVHGLEGMARLQKGQQDGEAQIPSANPPDVWGAPDRADGSGKMRAEPSPSAP